MKTPKPKPETPAAPQPAPAKRSPKLHNFAFLDGTVIRAESHEAAQREYESLKKPTK